MKKKEKADKEIREQLMRALADYDNLRKRVEREREQVENLVAARFISKFLPVFDMFYEASYHLDDSGLVIALTTLEQVLKDINIVSILPKPGEKFDERIHEAVEAVDASDKFKKGQIVETLLKGYKFIDGPIIRYAKVKVVKN